jgi:outer membrane protein assembly factor BamB
MTKEQFREPSIRLRAFMRIELLALAFLGLTACGGGGDSSPVSYIPSPTLTLLNANTAQAGCAAFSIAVVGTNVGDYSTVLWNGSPRPTTLIQPGVLQAQISSADIATAQTATVSISNPSPGGGVSAGASFTVTNGTPSVTSTAPSYLINPQHTNVATTACPVSLPARPAWTYALGANASYSIIASGKVFTVDHSGALYAFDELSGAVVWGPVATAGFGPAYDANTVYVVGNGPCCTNGFINAYSAFTGGLLFTGVLANQYSFSSAATALNGMVYTGGAGSGGTLYAVNGITGATVWTAAVANGDASTPAVTADGVYTVYPCRTYDFAPVTGASVWAYNGPCDGGGGATPTVANGLVYSPTVDGVNGSLFDAETGAMKGSYVADTTPALTMQYGYFVQSGKLSQIRLSDNVVLWTFPGDGNLVTSPVLVNQTVFVGSSSGTLYALDAATGTLLWTSSVGSLSSSQVYPDGYGPALAAGGGVLVVPTGNSIETFVISSSH